MQSRISTSADVRGYMRGAGHLSASDWNRGTDKVKQIGVAQYLEERFRPLTFVTEEKIEIYYRDELLRSLQERPLPELSEVSESIRRILEERAFNARVEEWIDGLKGRARIRRYVG